ncbi:PEGA domain-containing protein [Sorangium sp. So ce1014]|uniref:PEGA domain-containing protein n=1 Tax=Sorangium sp. So ce1014 TaxID=3133326 RepID=UPI003F61D021
MTMNCRPLALLLTAATVIAAPDIAAAQPAAPREAAASADAAARADASYRRGLRLYSDGKYVEAESELQSAWELNPTFDVAYNLGNTKYQLKKHREAAQYLSHALRHWPLMKAAAKLKPTAEKRLAESRAQVGALVVTASVVGAEVVVDGKAVGKAPLEGEVFVEPGEHRVEVRLEGYAPASETVKVAKGGTAVAALALPPAKSEAQEAAPGAKPVEGGSASGAAAGAPVAGMPPAEPAYPGPEPQKRSWVPVIALGAASAVGLGLGIGMTVASNNASADGRTQADAILKAGGGCPDAPLAYSQACSDLRTTASRVDTFARAATVAYTASGVLAIAAVTYALWPRSGTKASGELRVLPEAHIGYGGIVAQGAW